MKRLERYIEEFNPDWDFVNEMANIGYPILGKKECNVSVHGTNAGDRERPHFHIYLRNDVRPFSKFNIEIALDEILCYDEINILRLKDVSRNIDKRNRHQCDWSGYKSIEQDFEDWLFGDCEKRGDFIDNLDALIYFYNEESGNVGVGKNPILEYITSHGMKVLDKYHKYFSDDDKEKYNDCF